MCIRDNVDSGDSFPHISEMSTVQAEHGMKEMVGTNVVSSQYLFLKKVPKQLPRTRDVDHHIDLQAGAKPPFTAIYKNRYLLASTDNLLDQYIVLQHPASCFPSQPTGTW